MVSTHPTTDLLLWLRTLGGLAVVVGAPGWLVLARHLRTDPLTRIVASVAAGLLLLAGGASLTAAFGWPWDAGAMAALTAAAGLLLGRVSWFVETVRRLGSDPEPEPRTWIGVAVLCGGLAVLLAIGFAGLPAPPHLFDTSNHAFLLARVLGTGSTAPTELFGPPYGAPDLPYLVGWHAAVAGVAEVARAEPFQVMWLTVLFLVALLPASLAWLWREWGLRGPGLLVAVACVMVGHYTPLGILGWGGFGLLVATFLVPPLVVPLTRWLAVPTPLGGLLLGGALGTLFHVHASEVPVVAGLALVGWGQARFRIPWRELVLATPALMLGVLALGHAFFLRVLPAYVGSPEVAGDALRPVGKMLEEVVHAAGRWELLRGLWPLALVVGWRRRSRSVAFAAAVLAAVVVALGAGGDPVSRWLTTPFYREVPRVLYLFLFLIGPLVGWMVASGLERLPRPARRPVLGIAILAIVLPAQPGLASLFTSMHDKVPFSATDIDHARRLAEAVPPGSWVANVHNDGSTWAMHISDRAFLVPTRWGLGPDPEADLQAILGLRENPWPPETVALAARGVDFVYASRTRVPDDRVDPRVQEFTVDAFDADPRFEPRVVSPDAVLYAIRWATGR